MRRECTLHDFDCVFDCDGIVDIVYILADVSMVRLFGDVYSLFESIRPMPQVAVVGDYT
jgi:hypothetical protein